MALRPVTPPAGGELAAYDIARATAALAVLTSHARSFLLLDDRDQPALSGLGQLFYGLTAVGHQAVIVFFVVSGALVTRSMLALDAGGLWSWQRFATARLTRLWIVLLPCLLLGGCLDRLGMLLGDGLVYAGHYGALRPASPPVPVRLDWPTLTGNVAFLQTIIVPPYGSNVPLWSLANEAWYYLAAFLAWSAWRRRGMRLQGVAFLVALAVVATCLLTADMRRLAPTWALGAALTLLLKGRKAGLPSAWMNAVAFMAKPAIRLGSIALVALAIAGARANAVHHLLVGDDAIAVATAICLLAHHQWHPAPGWPLRVSRRLAHVSYSLYLSHFPLLALVAAVVLRNQRLPFGIGSLAVWAVAIGLALIYAAAVWWCFERHTARLRGWLHRAGTSARPRRSMALLDRGEVAR